MSEARKAIRALENEPARRDSLKRSYDSKWLLEVTFGNRFISRTSQTLPDTITSTDVAGKKSFFGLGLAHFITDQWRIGGGLDVTVLPKNQEIDFFSLGGGAITGSGQGSGGIVFNLTLESQYHFQGWNFTRPYVGAGFGVSSIRVRGGEVQFSTFSGQNQTIRRDTITARKRIPVSLMPPGLEHTMTPEELRDLVAYLLTLP